MDILRKIAAGKLDPVYVLFRGICGDSSPPAAVLEQRELASLGMSIPGGRQGERAG